MNLNELLAKYDKPAGGGNDLKFLQLKNDKDNVKCKFLFETEEDFLNFVKPVHNMKIGDYPNDIVCEGEGCKLCASGDVPKLKTVIPIYDVDKQEVLIWKRGVNTIKDIQLIFEDPDLLEELDGQPVNLKDMTFRITRQGEKGSTSTKYQIKSVKNVDVENFGEIVAGRPNIVGRDFKAFLKLTDEQKDELLTTGKIDWKKKADSEVAENSDTVDTDDIPF